jgi:uncharacterized protein (TIGR00251 family)
MSLPAKDKSAVATVQVKVVPGASKTCIVGRYGDAIKIQVAAAPEGGKANDAVIKLIADTLGIRRQQVQLVRGHAHPRKTIEVDGVDQATVDSALAGVKMS